MKIIDKLTEEILTNEYFNILYHKCSLLSADYNLRNINSENILTDKELIDTLKFSDILSNSTLSEARNKSYQIITYLNYHFKNDEIYRTFAKAVYSKLGNFPAINYLVDYNENVATLPILRAIEVDAKKLIQKVPDSENFVFTDSQFELYTQLSNTLEYSFSGPTSMGKSFIIKAFIKKVMRNSPPENLVILVPTRALINQFTLDLKDEIRELSEQYKYRILTNSSVNDFIGDEPHNYILILTPERLISYLSQENNPAIGFVFVDEAHKLANEKDSRSVTSYTAIEKTIKKYGNIKLYFSSPNVSNPEIFLQLFDRNKPNRTFKTNESPVSQNLFYIDLLDKNVELIQKDKNIKIKTTNLFEVANSTTELINHLGFDKNNLIYCNSKSKTISEANEFSKKTVNKVELSDVLQKAIKQIKEYIHPQYYLANLLECKVAFHYGKLPQLIRNLVEDLYKKEEVQNVFCTSTLLEGVNMPTQNIFILNGQNGNKPLSQIDFWNLSGRAGRLSRELYGNIFCVQHKDWKWENKELLNKSEIILKPTVLTKIDRNLRKIEKILKDQKISGSQEEQAILKYIANIISVDTLEIQSNYKSPLIERLIEKQKDKIIELAKARVQDYEIPSYILNSNQSINLKIQDKIFRLLKETHEQGLNIKLPGSQIKYTICLEVLQKMYTLYEWENAEKKLNNKESLKYYALLMNQWINGFSLNQIIKNSINHYETTGSKIHLGFIDGKPNYEIYQKDNIDHINSLIEKIIEDIEYILRFLFEKYFNHYYQIVVNILGEDLAGENWASLLEYGTQNRIAIALQNIGLSRHTALTIYRKCRYALDIEDGKLKNLNKKLILSEFKRETIEYDEIIRIL